VRIRDSAHDHGFTDAEIIHAVEFAIIAWYLDGYTMIVGPTNNGRLIEVGINDANGSIFHAMDARSKFLPQRRGK
jgi:hypothetical protein